MSALDKSNNYEFDQLIKVVQRENNKKRSFLFLNRLQAKYVPSNPKLTLDLFQSLGYIAAKRYKGKKAVIIGFAETATAIGAAVAGCFTEDSYYVHTTREELDRSCLAAAFEEEHSHATSHLLYSDHEKPWQDCEVVVFVDDEFTTGKTICNFVEALHRAHKLPKNTLLAAVSIINCMSGEDLDRFHSLGIEADYIMKEDRRWDLKTWEDNRIMDTILGSEDLSYKKVSLPGRLEIRRGAYIKDYQKACTRLLKAIEANFQLKEADQKLLILGTEECMYPAILTAREIQVKNPQREVVVYATSRSPILPLRQPNYPVFNRSVLRSLYNKDRTVFLYNITRYDKVAVVTDSQHVTDEAVHDLVTALKQYGNQDITFFKWEEV